MTQATNSVSALEPKRHPGVTYGTAWLLKHKIMEVMTLRDAGRKVSGRIEIDDFHLGGEVSGGKADRGSPDKVPFEATVQITESCQSVLTCLSQRPCIKESIQTFASLSLAAPATLVSDGLGCLTSARGTGILHEPHVTGGGVASAKHPSFLAVITGRGNTKASLSGTYPPSASKSMPIAVPVRSSTSSTADSTRERSCNRWLAQHLKRQLALCVEFARLIHLVAS